MEFNIPNNISPQFFELIAKRAGRKCLNYFISNYSKEGEESLGEFVRWAERKNKKNQKPLLVKSTKMKSNFELTSNKDGFQISNKMPYFRYHQQGGEFTPQRQMLYDNKQTEKIILDEIDFVIKNMLGIK